MPQEPKKRHSTQRQGKRRASIKLVNKALVDCQNCGAMILPHRVCPKCGYYKGKSIVVKKTKKQKSEVATVTGEKDTEVSESNK